MSKRYETKYGDFSKVEIALLLVGVVALLVLASAWIGFAFMILVGILFAQFGWLAPIGFMSAWGITFFGAVILGFSVRAAKGIKS